MPELPPELALLLNTLIQQMQASQASQEQLRQFILMQIDKLHIEMESFGKKEAIKSVEDDVAKIREEMKTGFEKLHDAIIESQEERFKKTITIQWTILSTILLGAIAYLLQQILPSILHH